jgi:dihydrofolate reductase
MRRIRLFMHITLDGFIAGPNGELDDLEPAAEEHEYANEVFAAADAVLFGRRIYEGFVEYWDALDTTDPALGATERRFATIFQEMSRIVCSRTLTSVDPRATLIAHNLAKQVGGIKQQPGGDVLLVCGPELLASLAGAGLIDDYLLLVHPVALGQGVQLFGQLDRKLDLELVEARAFASGTVLHQLRLLSAAA